MTIEEEMIRALRSNDIEGIKSVGWVLGSTEYLKFKAEMRAKTRYYGIDVVDGPAEITEYFGYPIQVIPFSCLTMAIDPKQVSRFFREDVEGECACTDAGPCRSCIETRYPK